MIHGLDAASKIRGLLAALPALARYAGKTVTVRCGAVARSDLLQDAAALRAVGAGVRLLEGGGMASPGEAGCLVFLAPCPGEAPLERMDVRRAEELLDTGALPEALRPLVRACIQAGAEEAAVLDSGTEHALLLYCLEQRVSGLAVTK